MKLNEFPEKIEPSSDDWLLIQDASGITYKISRLNFLSGISSNSGNTEAQTRFVFQSVGDEAGLFYYLGTNQYSTVYQNPVSRGSVEVSASSVFNSSFEPSNLLDRSTKTSHTNREQDAYFIIGLVDRLFQISAYTVRARTDDWSQIPRNWKLQGTNDYSAWDDLDEQINVSNFYRGEWLKIDINSTNSYKGFRFIQTASNDVGDYYLTLGEIELYGEIVI